MIEPLVPIDLDLRDFRWMKLDLVALFNSEFNATSNDTAWRAGVTLWGKSWHQVPAGSLPDNDAMLAGMAGFGRDLRGWKPIRDIALHGFEKATDGRLYHPFVCKMAIEADEERKAYQSRTEAKTKRQARWRQRSAEICEALREHGITPPAGASLDRLESLLADAHKRTNGSGNGHDVDASVDVYVDATKASPVDVYVDCLDRDRDRDREKEIEKESAGARGPTVGSEATRVIAEFDRLLVLLWGTQDTRHFPDSTDSVFAQRMLDAGASVEFISQTMAHHMDEWHREGQKPPKRLSTFEKFVETAIRRRDKSPGKRVVGANGHAPTGEQFFDQEFERWKARVGIFREKGTWYDDRYGPKPGEPNCRAPPELLIGLVRG